MCSRTVTLSPYGLQLLIHRWTEEEVSLFEKGYVSFNYKDTTPQTDSGNKIIFYTDLEDRSDDT